MGNQLLQRGTFDLVYFSTTQFPVHRLGLTWQKRFGVPFAMDLQDPWVNDYYREHPDVCPPGGRWKYAIASRSARRDEFRCLSAARAVTVVSGKYTTDLARRYPHLDVSKFTTLPFGASERDFQLAENAPTKQAHIPFGDGHLHWVSVGRGGDDMRTALRSLFRGFRQGLERSPTLRQVRMHFLGTDYAARDRVRHTVSPIAAEEGVAEFVVEQPLRIPYSEALTCLKLADRLILCGSNDPSYNPSKVGLCLLSGRPILAVMHKSSPATEVLVRSGHACATFQSEDDDCSAQVLPLLENPPRHGGLPVELTAARMSQTLAHVFDQALHS